MPQHNIKRQEEVSPENWIELIEIAENLDYSRAYIVPPFQFWFSCVLAVDWLTGKRINEILMLKRKDVSFTEKKIRLRFHIGKKKHRNAPIERQPYQKAKTIEHLAVPYIKKYLDEYDLKIDKKDGWLFPAPTYPRTRIVKTKFVNGENIEEIREYSYDDPGGYVYEENARFWLNKVNCQVPEDRRIYFHYGRHSIGIKLAYQGKSDIEIAAILDETPRAALEYTKHAGGIGKEWENETE